MRTTKKQLEAALYRLNEATGNAQKPYGERGADGRLTVNAGCYVLDWAYGGVQLAQMCEGGGQRNIQPCRGTKTQCWDIIQTSLKILEGQLCDK